MARVAKPASLVRSPSLSRRETIRVHIRGGEGRRRRRSRRCGEGEILGLIGPNGAGKTTLVNVLSGFQRATTARVVLGGEDITAWTPSEIARAGARAHLPGRAPVPGLTVFENVEAAAVSTGATRREARALSWEILERVGLEQRAGGRGRRAAARRAAAARDRAGARGAAALPAARRARRRARRGRVGRARRRARRDQGRLRRRPARDRARHAPDHEAVASASRCSTTARRSRSARRPRFAPTRPCSRPTSARQGSRCSEFVI